ncbi:MAG: thioredoxin family protein [Saprospiraceae bacterium]|nr:thioredoxin family protein [Saprospiraceae bacterium]
MYHIPASVIEKAISYPAFRELSQQMAEEGFTSGPNQSPIMIRYTEINDFRMNRLDRTTKILPEVTELIQAIDQPLLFLTITEAWCGDGAQILPVIEKLASINDKIVHKLIFRDENPEVMDNFLTNGARSIPIIVIADPNSGKVLGHWGPRPKKAHQLIMDTKKLLASIEDEKQKEQAKNESQAALQSWYAKDKTKSIQREFLEELAHPVYGIR